MSSGCISKLQPLFRVQAADGRGPWRPGMSHLWTDETRTSLPAGIVDAFGTDWLREIPRAWHAGCACRGMDGLRRWFTPVELKRLDGMGYKAVGMYADRIVRENDDQIIFARRLPLNEAAVVVPWDLLDADAVAMVQRHLRRVA